MPTVDIANEDIAGAKIDFHFSAFPLASFMNES
jgi:hypothetical protein